jgi:catechol 2,3-dioxygenase-like lactoylglutathione lyase family enzyme
MPVTGLNHVNIRTTDVEASARFYVDIFDFQFRQGAEIMGQRQNWLYDQNGQPIIHFRLLETDSDKTGPIDHVALSCVGKAAIVERLQARNIEFGIAENLIPGVTQVFLKDPHGVPLELNFAGE